MRNVFLVGTCYGALRRIMQFKEKLVDQAKDFMH